MKCCYNSGLALLSDKYIFTAISKPLHLAHRHSNAAQRILKLTTQYVAAVESPQSETGEKKLLSTGMDSSIIMLE